MVLKVVLIVSLLTFVFIFTKQTTNITSENFLIMTNILDISVKKHFQNLW